eukprot:Sspe_Gene.103881::Locus_79735_Transcript_1_1_Confidence_1.000_Length_1309::g.103881::m.103881
MGIAPAGHRTPTAHNVFDMGFRYFPLDFHSVDTLLLLSRVFVELGETLVFRCSRSTGALAWAFAKTCLCDVLSLSPDDSGPAELLRKWVYLAGKCPPSSRLKTSLLRPRDLFNESIGKEFEAYCAANRIATDDSYPIADNAWRDVDCLPPDEEVDWYDEVDSYDEVDLYDGW